MRANMPLGTPPPAHPFRLSTMSKSKSARREGRSPKPRCLSIYIRSLSWLCNPSFAFLRRLARSGRHHRLARIDSPAAHGPMALKTDCLAPAFPHPRSPMRLKARLAPAPASCNRARGGGIDKGGINRPARVPRQAIRLTIRLQAPMVSAAQTRGVMRYLPRTPAVDKEACVKRSRGKRPCA